MKKKISEVSSLESKKINSSLVNVNSYISTENMLANFGGITSATNIPCGSITSFTKQDILLSNIRPYFRKIWFSNINGGCSNDVIVIRSNKKLIVPRYLYYSLCTDNFINNYVAACIGTKMPRGNKNVLLDWKIEVPSLIEQQHIVNTISSLLLKFL